MKNGVLDKTDEEIRKLYYNDYSYKFISERVGLSVAAVKSRVQRMRNAGHRVERWFR